MAAIRQENKEIYWAWKAMKNTARLYGIVYWDLLDQVEEIIENYI